MAELSTDSESASTLDSEINEILGDFSEPQADESPESAEGTTPAAETAKTEVGAEGADKEVRAETTSEGAAKTEPDNEDEVETTSDDPLKDAKPFTYSFNGEEKAIEGMQVLSGGGAIVPAEALAILTERLADGERFHSTTREQFAQIQNYEKLSAFHTKDAEGKDVVLSGSEGLLHTRMQLATLSAAYETLANAIKDPQILVGLLAQNDKGEVILNQREFQNLVTRSDLAEKNADTKARAYFGDVIKPVSKPEATQVDYVKEAPQAIESAARAAKVDAKTLTEADRKFLGDQFPRYVRAATKEDLQFNPTFKVGQQIVDAGFAQVVKAVADKNAELQKTAKATQTAADENTKRLAAAAIGNRNATKVVVEKPKDTSRADDAAAAWAARERAAAAGM